jgi:DNA repair protein RadC
MDSHQSDYAGHRSRLRKRFFSTGLEGFHDHEVLELILTYVIPRRDVKPIAKALLKEFKSLAAILDAPQQHLLLIDGIGEQAAGFFNLIPQLVARYLNDRWKKRRVFSSIKDAAEFLVNQLKAEKSEIFLCISLSSQNALIAKDKIQEGTVNRATVYPRLVVESALKHRATAVILAHNHPGGHPSPSDADRRLTRKLKHIFQDLDITLHDHIIVAGEKYYSFAEHGAI